MGDDRESSSVAVKVCAGPPSVGADAELLNTLLAQKKKLEQLNTWFDVALNNMVRGLSMFDADMRLVVCNKSYRQIYGLPEELIRPGTPFADIMRYYMRRETGRDGEKETAQRDEWLKQHQRKLAAGRSFCNIQNMRDGRKVLVTYQPLADGGWVDVQEDVTEKRRAEEKIEWLARHDALTGVANRFYFRETFENSLKELTNGDSLALHWLDLDGFKEVNDTHGHPIGDALLKAVAQRLRGSVRKTDFIARLGGDEFAIIQAGARSPEQCARLARRVLQDISKPYHIFGHEISISTSIGIVCAPESGDCADELLKYADIALYEVKSAGRRGFKQFKGGGGRRAKTEGGLEVDIHSALAQKQLELHYQPVLSLRTGQVASCEALLRWRHPKAGLVAPGEFLPIAERTGAIIDIGRWVLEQACRDAAFWSKDVKVTVNLSLLQIESGDLRGVVEHALGVAGVEAGRLRLEIGESLLDRNEDEVREALERLRKLGVGIALDDFGKTSASLSNLRYYPFDAVTIDRTLIKDVPQHEDSAAVIQAVALLARSLRIETIAEGVETLDELNAVARAGCSKVQGYYFSRPVPHAELAAAVLACPQKLALAA